MDSRFVWTAVALVAVTGVSVVLVNLSGEKAMVPSAEPVSNVEIPDVPSEAPAEQPEEEQQYMLKVYEERIGIFALGESEPEMVLDVYVKFLPEYDRGQLEQGVLAHNFDQLTALIEDYSS